MRILILLLALGTTACGSTVGKPLADNTVGKRSVTAFTTRIPGADPQTQTIAISQAVYTATREENAAGAIILTKQDPALAFTAMHRITHMPVNAPLFYLDESGQITPATLQEMKRIRPDGVVPDGKTQVYVIGKVNPDVIKKIRTELAYKVRHFDEDDPLKLADVLDRWQAAVKADHVDEIVVSALDHKEGMLHGIGAMGWNAHMGKGFAWVNTDSVPEETKRILKRRWGQNGCYIYVTGGPDVVSDSVVEELSKYGLVRRIFGKDIIESNTVNAGYKDFGGNLGWWWGKESRSFGWGLAQSGHNYIFVHKSNLLAAIPAALLGHMGKHGPILVVDDSVPKAVEDYLNMVRPHESGPGATIRNHGWIIGDEKIISWETQKSLHKLLAPEGVVVTSPVSTAGN